MLRLNSLSMYPTRPPYHPSLFSLYRDRPVVQEDPRPNHDRNEPCGCRRCETIYNLSLHTTSMPIPTPSAASSLPVELIAKIVTLALDMYFLWSDESKEHQRTETMGPHAMGGPWRYAQINKAWRMAVIGDPSLWQRIDISQEATQRMRSPQRLLKRMMVRSYTMPLKFRYSTISCTTQPLTHPRLFSDSFPHARVHSVRRITAPTFHDIALLELLMRHSGRWHTAHIATHLSMYRLLNGVKGHVEALESLTLNLMKGDDQSVFLGSLVAFHKASKLRHVVLLGDMELGLGRFPEAALTHYEAFSYNSHPHTISLREMPNLVACTLNRWHPVPDLTWYPHYSGIIDMPHLTALKTNDLIVLRMIKAPALKHLDVSSAAFEMRNSDGSLSVSTFVNKSACELESIMAHWGPTPSSAVDVINAISEIRSLKLVHLVGMTSADLFTLLNTHSYDRGALPSSLRTLVIDVTNLWFLREDGLRGMLEHFDISLHTPTTGSYYPLLKITFTAPPGDLRDATRRIQDHKSKLFRGEGRLVHFDEASPVHLPQKTEWPTNGNGFWGGEGDCTFTSITYI